MNVQALMMGYETPLIIVDSAHFDGTNDYMTRGAGLNGAADSKTGIVSFWVRLDGGDGTAMEVLTGVTTLAGATQRFVVVRGGTNKFSIGAWNAGGTVILDYNSSAYTAGATWLHVLASWDLSASARNLYINDVSDVNAVSTLTNDTIDYTLADWGVGANPDGSSKMNGCFAEMYFAPGQYLDFSAVYNRRKFISSGKKPVYLGSTGALPTGTAPLIYQHLDHSEAVADFATNRSTGGNFTITGTLDTASTSPSD